MRGLGATTTAGRRTAGSTTAASRCRHIVEYERCLATTIIDEVDVRAAQVFDHISSNDQFDTGILTDEVIIFDSLRECHSKTDTATTSWLRVDTDTFDITFDLADKLCHLPMRSLR